MAYAAGAYADAEGLYRQGLAIGRDIRDQWTVMACLNNLGELYRAQSRYAEAEPLYKRSLSILEKALGPDHPDVATVLKDYAGFLREVGKTEEAETMEARAERIRSERQ